MTTGDHLLAEIVKPENRADDTLRIIYADWLEENGQPERAEFIRVQVEIARMPNCIADEHTDGTIVQGKQSKQGDALAACERELMSDHYLDWAAGPVEEAASVGEWVDGEDHWIYTRGFISSLRLPWESWRENADAILAAHPIEKVVLTTRPPDDHFRYLGGQHAAADEVMRRCLAATWPHIEFDLPPAVVGVGTSEQDIDDFDGTPFTGWRAI
jgi:uncharacterized protein (TIGR02996 family)